jgi:phage tail-like protein
MTTATTASGLLRNLPAVYQDDPFLGRFLLAFEDVLIGPRDAGSGDSGLEQLIAGLATCFDPLEAREDFLPWLADWTAFTLRDDLAPLQQRNFLANVIQHYRQRGTKQNLQELLAIFTVGTPTVTETPAAEFEIGVHSTIGVDTYLSGGAAHYFQVTVSLPWASQASQARQMAIASALIELEKPAHTAYSLKVIFPSMQISVHSRVGVDTLLGALPPATPSA